MKDPYFQQMLRQKFGLVLVLTRETLQNQQKGHRFFKKTVIGIFNMAFPLRNRHIFMWRPMWISIVFSILTLKQISVKRTPYSRHWSINF